MVARMTTQHLIADLKRDEGLERDKLTGEIVAYPDPLTRAEPLTIGYGHTGKEVHKGLVWTQEQADAALASDVERIIHSLDAATPWWRTMNDARQDVLANMGFNMGLTSLLSFHHTLGAMRSGDYETAAAGMLASLWARQVKGRARRLAEQMRTGVRT